jgi:anthranilate phosphoribosyltransferase
VVRDVFAGAPGAVRDAVLLNAGIALALTRPDSGASETDFDGDVRAGMDLAAEAIDSGAATSLVDRWVAATRR